MIGRRTRSGWKNVSWTLFVFWTLALTGQVMAREEIDAVAPEPPAVADENVADNLDTLLDMADEDFGQVSRVNVMAPALQTEVSTVSRQTSTVGRSPAAVFVVSNEMIRRSGATSIPETLRMVPGVNVARITANRWAVSIRGFNGRFANKLLVQIDGRSVYTPTFSGVYWDAQDVLLEDVERIEVIRGPGAAVWGANAVNGIINIITKRARHTQGVLVQGGGGSEERGFSAIRYGGTVGDSLHWRVYGKQFERDHGFAPGNDAQDDWGMGQGGFRMDWEPCEHRTLTVQGDYYDGRVGRRSFFSMPVPPYSGAVDEDEELSGANVLARFTRKLDEQSDWSLQAYYDGFRRRNTKMSFEEDCDTFDLDFQHRFPLGQRHAMIWGANYRYTQNHLGNRFNISANPDSRAIDIVGCFVQDEITLCDDLLYLAVGSKFEHNDFTGFEAQPTARLLWTPNPRQAAWASISRAVRTPSRLDHDIRMTFLPMSTTPPMFLQMRGNRDVESEELIAYEVGFRSQPSENFFWDLAMFYHDYENLVTMVPGPPEVGPLSYFPLNFTNAMQGETYGVELAATYQINPCWKIHGAYSHLRMHLHADPGAVSTAEADEGESPQNQVCLQSSWDLNHGLQFDLTGRYVDSLPALGVPSYLVMDARLGWQPRPQLEMAVVARNLLDAEHAEFSTRQVAPTEVQHEVYGMVTWRY